MSSTTSDAATTEVDELLIDSATNLFASTCTFDVVQRAEESGWAPDVWNAVAEAGFAWIGVDAEGGGSGGSLADACAVLRIAGAHAAPIPLAETGILGGWLLADAGLALPDGPVTVIPGTANDTLAAGLGVGGSVQLSGWAHRVAWATKSDKIVALLQAEGADRGLVVAISPDQATIEESTNLAGEPRATLSFDGVTIQADNVAPATTATPERLRLRGALSRASLMAGALQAMSRLTVDYTEQRQQFGRPVGRFQAVQQHLVWGAQDAALTTMAAEVAARQATIDLDAAHFEIASAKIVADDSASTATRGSHQAHGAMGMTQEYALHHLSRRLWAWRHEWASPGEWPAYVGRITENGGPEGLYPRIAS